VLIGLLNPILVTQDIIGDFPAVDIDASDASFLLQLTQDRPCGRSLARTRSAVQPAVNGLPALSDWPEAVLDFLYMVPSCVNLLRKMGFLKDIRVKQNNPLIVPVIKKYKLWSDRYRFCVIYIIRL